MSNRLKPAALLVVLASVAGPAAAMPTSVSAGGAAPKSSAAGVTVVLLSESGKESSVPLFSTKSSQVAVAKVGDRVITLQELAAAMGSAHEEHAPGAKSGPIDFHQILDRLIRVKLIVAEAKTMGMGELPEVTQSLAGFDEVIPRETLKSQATSKVKPDPKAVDKLYKAATRENVIATVLFADEALAKAFASRAGKGGDFAAAARDAVARKEATAFSPAMVADPTGVSPEVVTAVNQLKPGGISPALPVPRGFAVIQLVRIQYRDDPKARAEAIATVSAPLKRKALEDYYSSLRKKYARVDEKLLTEVDLDAPAPGFEAMLKDQRPLVAIDKEKPITVGDLASEIERALFHGAKQAAKGQKLNPRKKIALDNLTFRRLLDHEAAVKKVRETQEFRGLRAQAEDDLLFKSFLDKVIIPDLKTSDAEVERHYQAHRAEYTRPAMVRLEAIGFVNTQAAQSAADLLRSGADLAWLRANAEGRLPEDKVQFKPGSTPIIASDLPGALAKVVTEAKAGDYRVYTAGKDEAYVVRVTDIVPAAPRPMEEVRTEILGKLGLEKLQQGIVEYGDRLRQARDVKVYVVRIVG